jgi:hypothetical protein
MEGRTERVLATPRSPQYGIPVVRPSFVVSFDIIVVLSDPCSFRPPFLRLWRSACIDVLHYIDTWLGDGVSGSMASKVAQKRVRLCTSAPVVCRFGGRWVTTVVTVEG